MSITTKAAAAAFDTRALTAIAAVLATTADQLREGTTIDTRYGPAYVHYHPCEKFFGREYHTGWLHVRFESVERAKKGLAHGNGDRLNQYSGKWNFMDLEGHYLGWACAELARVMPLSEVA